MNLSFNIKITVTKVYIVILSIILISGCNNKQNSVATNDTLITDSATEINLLQADSITIDTSVVVNYLFPSPDEMLEEILSAKLEYNSQIINSYTNVNLYVDTKHQALNLGVYLSDLAYINLYGDKNTALLYFKSIRDLAQDLNIYKVFDEDVYTRMQNNIANKDSITAILNGMYGEIRDLLESSQRNNIYALVASGALIEALYISVSSISSLEDYKQMATKIFEQKYLVKNFYEFAYQYKKDPNVKEVMELLDNFKTTMERAETKQSESQITKSKGHITIKGGEEITVSEKDFNNFKENVTKIRQSIVHAQF